MRKFIDAHRNDVIWLGWLLYFAIFEGKAIRSRRPGDTFSERTRAWFRTSKPVGKIVFGVVWVVFTCWYFWHILWQKVVKPKVQDG